MTRLFENSIVNQFKVVKELSRDDLWVEYLVEHLFIGSFQRLRLIRADLCARNEYRLIIEKNIDAIAKLWHPYAMRIFIKGEYDNSIFFTTNHYSGESLKDIFVRQKIQSVGDFFTFHSRLFDLFYYLFQEDMNFERITLKDFKQVNSEPLLTNLNIFRGLEFSLRNSGQRDLIASISNQDGLHAVDDSVNTKENLRAIARIMYQTVGWGELEQAIKIKQREETTLKKKKESTYIPLIPNINPRIETLILKSYADKSEGGYVTIKELIEDFKTITNPAQKEISHPVSLSITLPSQKPEQEPHLIKPEEKKEIFEVSVPEQPAADIEFETPFRESFELPETEINQPRMRRRGLDLLNILKMIIMLGAAIILAVGIYYFVAVVFTTENNPPVARATVPSNFVPLNSKIILDGNNSYDPDNDKLSYYWEVLGQNSESVVIVENRSNKAGRTEAIFSKKGQYTIRLKVFDGSVFSEPAVIVINVY